MNGATPSYRRPWDARCRAAAWTAVAAGVFAAAVCAVLAVNHVRDRSAGLLNSTELEALAKQVDENPADESLREQYRVADARLREEHFRRAAMTTRARWMLLVAGALAVVALDLLAHWRKKLPSPTPGTAAPGQGLREARRGRWAVGAAGLVLAAAAGAVAMLGAGRAPVPEVAVEPSKGSPSTQASLPAEDAWSRFRGPGGQGIYNGEALPVSWNAATGEGIAWKVPVPLAGHSSPIVWGDRVFLTGADKETREVYCLDAADGALLWRRAVRIPGEPAEAPRVYDVGGHAVPTPTTDGRRVCALFANGDLACFDFEGRQLWAKAMGPLDNAYGHASSPIISGGLVIVQLDQGGQGDGESYVAALNVQTGDIVWDAPRPVGASWTTPIVIEAVGGKQLIAGGNPLAIAHDLKSGSEIWRADCLGPDMAPSAIYAGGLVIVVNPGMEAVGIRPDGRGDVTDSHVVWRIEEDVPDITSPVSDGKLLWLLMDGLTCCEVKTGRKLWRHDLAGPFQASPVLADGRLYLLSEDGLMHVVGAGDRYEPIGTGELDRQEKYLASPAAAGGRIYVRSYRTGDEGVAAGNWLYCVGGKK